MQDHDIDLVFAKAQVEFKEVNIMKSLKRTLVIFLVTISSIIAIYLKCSNIDMTDTRLFITYWKEYIFLNAVFICGCIFLKGNDR